MDDNSRQVNENINDSNNKSNLNLRLKSKSKVKSKFEQSESRSSNNNNNFPTVENKVNYNNNISTINKSLTLNELKFERNRFPENFQKLNYCEYLLSKLFKIKSDDKNIYEFLDSENLIEKFSFKNYCKNIS